MPRRRNIFVDAIQRRQRFTDATMTRRRTPCPQTVETETTALHAFIRSIKRWERLTKLERAAEHPDRDGRAQIIWPSNA